MIIFAECMGLISHTERERHLIECASRWHPVWSNGWIGLMKVVGFSSFFSGGLSP